MSNWKESWYRVYKFYADRMPEWEQRQPIDKLLDLILRNVSGSGSPYTPKLQGERVDVRKSQWATSIRQIAKLLGEPPTTVKRLLKELIGRGLIRVESRPRKWVRITAMDYQTNLAQQSDVNSGVKREKGPDSGAGAAQVRRRCGTAGPESCDANQSETTTYGANSETAKKVRSKEDKSLKREEFQNPTPTSAKFDSEAQTNSASNSSAQPFSAAQESSRAQENGIENSNDSMRDSLETILGYGGFLRAAHAVNPTATEKSVELLWLSLKQSGKLLTRGEWVSMIQKNLPQQHATEKGQ